MVLKQNLAMLNIGVIVKFSKAQNWCYSKI